MHTEDITIFSLDLNFARCLVTCPLLLQESISPWWRSQHILNKRNVLKHMQLFAEDS